MAGRPILCGSISNKRATEETSMKQVIRFLPGVFLTSLIALCPCQAAGAGGYENGYRTYSNARFAYSISYPSDLLVPQGESDNGDGQKFQSKDVRAVMLVYG